MKAGLDVGPTQLYAVVLSRVYSLVPFDWQSKKKSFFTASNVAEQNFQVQKDRGTGHFSDPGPGAKIFRKCAKRM